LTVLLNRDKLSKRKIAFFNLISLSGGYKVKTRNYLFSGIPEIAVKMRIY
jgi:hypothetical protein